MQLASLSPSLLYALLSLNPNAVSTLASLSSSTTTTTTTSTTPIKQDTNTLSPPTIASAVIPSHPLSHRSLLTYRTYPDILRRQEAPGIVNATVTCRNGEFQNPDDDIVAIVCGQYYKCGDGSEAEQVTNGEDTWSATCIDCVGGQESEKASGCVYTEM